MSDASPAEQLDGFIDRYTPEVAATAREALEKVRALLPGAVELVYDNYNALAVAFGPTERTSEAVLSVTLFPRWVSVFFLRGTGLPDPHGLLKGSGSQTRHLVLEDAADLDRPQVRELIAQAVARAPQPLDGTRPGRIVIKSVSAKQRPRRPG
ncbi:MAG TPA: DUF1801 domain-containing protein [Longimicrobium sp.]|jgi:hypothetical protein